MNMFRVIVLTVALVAGGIAAYLALSLDTGPNEAAVIELAPQIQTRDVLVASANIAPGAAIKPEDLRWEAWPETAVNPTFIDKTTRPEAAEELVGTVVRSLFVEGEPIRNGKLARPESGFMSAILPSGMRAVAVRVSAASTAGGFILPNDRVDIILTREQEGGAISQTLLSNIRILAIDQTVQEQDGERVVVGKTATLELDPSQVEILTSAQASGDLSLALRSMAEADETPVASSKKQTGRIQIFRSGHGHTVQTQ